jgi:hypothetical protein
LRERRPLPSRTLRRTERAFRSRLKGRTVTKNFDVAAGASTTLSLTGLPVGQVTFSAEAFGAACATATNGAADAGPPTWVSSAAVTTSVAVSPPAAVTLAMVHNGSASVAVDFTSDDAAAPTPPGTADGGVDAAAPQTCTLAAAQALATKVALNLESALAGGIVVSPPEQTFQVDGGTVSICNTVNISSGVAQCNFVFGGPISAFAFDPATSTFSLTMGGVASLSGGISIGTSSCTSLTVSTPTIALTGTLQTSVANSNTAQFAVVNLSATPGAVSTSGCPGAIQAELSQLSAELSNVLAQDVAAALSVTFTEPCP